MNPKYFIGLKKLDFDGVSFPETQLFWYRFFNDIIAVYNASFDPLQAKIDRSCAQQSTYEFPLDLPKKSISEETLKRGLK